ncbi:site-specific integrase [Streptomyces violaceusniger]|uniref:site-specific integrase n=1 Tax=Streptomyces violaceusniger TaxID=68280 RepID=UPI00099687E1
MYLGAPKTKKSRRTLVLTPDQVELFKRACLGKQPQDLIFTAPGGGSWHSGFVFAHRWKPALDAANAGGLTKRPRVHDLRHTHASWLIAGKVPLPVMQGRLGHESITTTVDRYGHLPRPVLMLLSGIRARPVAGRAHAPPRQRSVERAGLELAEGRGAVGARIHRAMTPNAQVASRAIPAMVTVRGVVPDAGGCGPDRTRPRPATW